MENGEKRPIKVEKDGKVRVRLGRQLGDSSWGGNMRKQIGGAIHSQQK